MNSKDANHVALMMTLLDFIYLLPAAFLLAVTLDHLLGLSDTVIYSNSGINFSKTNSTIGTHQHHSHDDKKEHEFCK